MPNSYRVVDYRFTGLQHQILKTGKVLVPSYEKWSDAQIESVARLQSKEYAARIVLSEHGFSAPRYTATPRETKPMYDAQDEFARWCSTGEHAFDPNDKGRKRATITEYDDDGQPVEVVRVMCGPCASKTNFMQKPKVEIAPPKADTQLYSEFLEWKNGIRADEPTP